MFDQAVDSAAMYVQDSKRDVFPAKNASVPLLFEHKQEVEEFNPTQVDKKYKIQMLPLVKRWPFNCSFDVFCCSFDVQSCQGQLSGCTKQERLLTWLSHLTQGHKEADPWILSLKPTTSAFLCCLLLSQCPHISILFFFFFLKGLKWEQNNPWTWLYFYMYGIYTRILKIL